jgi:hypothetical protein
MKKLILKLYGDNWVEDFWVGTGIALALDFLIFLFTTDYLFILTLLWFSVIIIMTIACLLWMVYEKITPKIIKRGVLYILKILWKINFSYWFWGVVMLLTLIWFWFFR